MKIPSEMLAHRSTSSSQISDNSSSSSSDDTDDGSSEEESSNEEGTQKNSESMDSASNNNYLHNEWMLKDHDKAFKNDMKEKASKEGKLENNKHSTDVSESYLRRQDSSSGSESSGSSEGSSSSSRSSFTNRSKPNKRLQNKKDIPLWESNPQIYGVRRSSRSKKDTTRMNLNEDSDEGQRRISKKKRSKDYDATTTLTESSEEESDEYEEPSSKKQDRTGSKLSRLSAMRSKLQGRKIKSYKASKAGGGRGSRKRQESEDTTSDDDNQPVRASSRIQRNNTVSYKENDSTQETDSDDLVEIPEKEWAIMEDAGEDTDAIEKIMDCRVGRLGATGNKTTAYAVKNSKDPNENFNTKTEEGEVQYMIKWKEFSHLHNTWESEATLRAQNCRGLKRLENFMKRQDEIDVWMKASSPEDREYYYCQQEMNRNVLSCYCNAERIIGRSATRNEQGRWDYHVKWKGLPYSECTWEDAQLIDKDFQSEINAFEMRQDNPCIPKRDCKVLRHRPRFVPMTRQPDWLPGKLKLRDYQLEGVNWLAHSWCKGNSVILADEMGLGKTIQSITFLSYLYHTHELYGLFLIIVPLSTMPAWQTEFQSWAPHMNVITYMGDQSSREKIRNVEWLFPNKHYKFNAVLTSYEILLKDKSFLGSHSWAVIAVDEAHRLKNDDSLLYRSLREFKSNHHLLITGTPLQNSLKELWALLHYIMPEKFDSWSDFEDEHGQNRDSGYASLHKVLHPFLLRRVKKDVEKSLPAKVEQILRIPMASLQKQYYKWLLTKNYAALTKGQRGSFSSFCNIIMELKKCCNHAYLVKPPEHEPTDRESILQSILRNSGKMVLLDKLLLRLRENGHRVLIFSQMVRMLDIIQEYLVIRRLQFQRLDGSVSSDLRRRALDHFNAENSEDFCFLLSTRAGGLGINLATADTVIIFDSDWNPMNDLQAQARAHRIGQKNQVNIYRLVCAGSVEEDIIERAKRKMVLDHLIIQRMDTSGKTVLFKKSNPSSTANNPFHKDELEKILKFGTEELFQENDDEEKDVECDIDDILQRAETRAEQVDASAGNELLSAFKVANFNLDEDEAAEMGKDWDQIIPEKDRRKIEDEKLKKQEAELYLPRRARKKIKINAGSESDNNNISDSGSSEDDEDGGEEVEGAPKKRGRPARSGHRDEESYIKGFTTAEARRFVRSFRKFGDPLTRLDAIARDAELSEQSEADLQRLGQKLHDKLQQVGNDLKLTQETVPENKEETKSSRGRGPSFRLAGVSVSVKTTLSCIADLQPLVDVIPKQWNDRKTFRLNIPIRPMYTWGCDWAIEDDSRLLVGIYEYGMGSWEQIQGDPALKLDQKILRPNGEKPQAKQLQSRSEYLIKLLKKAQDQKHPGVPQPSATNSKSRKQKESKTPSSESKKKGSRKIKSKSRIQPGDTDDEPQVTSIAAATSEAAKVKNGNVNAEDEKNKKRKRRKRKATENETTVKPEDVDAVEKNEKRRKKHSKDASHPSKPTNSKAGPVHITMTPDPVPGNDEFSGELDPETFRECKERLRPVKKALKQLDRPPAVPEGNNEQVKNDHTRKCLLQIGDRVISCLRELHDPEAIKVLRKNLWIFVSKFTEHNAEKLHKLYKLACKRRDHDKKEKHEKHSIKTSSNAESAKKDMNTVKSSTTEQTKDAKTSRKIQHKSSARRSSSPNTLENKKANIKASLSPKTKDRNWRSEQHNALDSKPSDRNPPPGHRPRISSPSRHYEDNHRYMHGNKHEEYNDMWRRGGRSPNDYRGRRSNYDEPRPRGRSPSERMYPREMEYDRHSRDYRMSPQRHRPPEHYGGRWGHHSPPPGDFPPNMDRDGRHPPPRGYPYHPPSRSPPGRSPPGDYRMGRHHRRYPPSDHYPPYEGRPRHYYQDSPVRGSPAGFSPPSDSMSESLRRTEKT